MTRDVPFDATEPVPQGLLDAFWAYDEALLGNDVEAMSRLFAPGESTLRGDGSTVLVSHEAITSFRSGRRVIPTRRVVGLHVRMLGADAGLVMAETAVTDPSGAVTKRGLQTQLLQRGPGGWQITAAHVSSPVDVAPAEAAPATQAEPPLTELPPTEPIRDVALWRVLGDPLVAGADTGALAGLGVAVKDLFAVKGYRIGAGVPDWLREQQPAERNSPAVQLLLDAGAHVVGIAQTDEFAYSVGGINSHYGAPPNPRVPHATIGGSSNGPASAVALGVADIGLGTDTAGSIRVPASYAGLIGVRSTHGFISMADTVPLAPQFDVAGWLTRDVAAAIRVCDVMISAAQQRPLDAKRTFTIPALREYAQRAVNHTIDSAIEKLVAQNLLPPLEILDISTERLDAWFAAFRVVQGWQAWEERGAWVTAHPHSLGPDIAARYAVAAKISRPEADAAKAAVADAASYFADLLQDAIIALPTTSSPAIPLSASPVQTEAVRAGTLRLTFIASAAGLPAVSLPLGSVDDSWQPQPLPVGLQLIGAPGVERGLLELAAEAVS